MKTIHKMLLAVLLCTGTLASNPLLADEKSVWCLAKNIYHEARGESLAGKLAVAKVTLNRVGHHHFPDTVCGVVYQPRQFSWTRQPQLRVKDLKAWQESLHIARDAIYNGLDEVKLSALYFHSIKIKPNWKRKREAKIGSHVFYR